VRADRLVAALLFLQQHRRITAAQLAAELEVSVRTARRDLEALSMAGVPVYAQRGTGGGWSLIGGGRTDLTGLNAAEARALFLLLGPAARIDPTARGALRKLVQALPETFRADASSAASAVVVDPARWGRRREPLPPYVELLQRALIDGVQVRMTYSARKGSVRERIVHPLGLIEKGSSWYLVADTDAGRRSFRLDRIESAVSTGQPVVRPHGFDLAREWESVVASVEARRRRIRAVVRVDSARVPGLRAQFGDDLAWDGAAPAGDSRGEVRIHGASAEILANELAGWGDDIEVVRPGSVRAALARIGGELVARYGEKPGRTA
jgi:predicted DNA-binding transcriptional regulator YafY